MQTQIPDDSPLESDLITKSLDSAQERVEEVGRPCDLPEGALHGRHRGETRQRLLHPPPPARHLERGLRARLGAAHLCAGPEGHHGHVRDESQGVRSRRDGCLKLQKMDGKFSEK